MEKIPNPNKEKILPEGWEPDLTDAEHEALRDVLGDLGAL